MDDLNPLQTVRAPGWPEQGEASERAFCQRIARVAVRSLYAELVLYPKPGLVSKVDNGSHTDMTAATFVRSLFALRRYFGDITRAGMLDAPFHLLKQLAIVAWRAIAPRIAASEE